MSLPRRISGIGLFALGLLLTVTLIVLTLWPDMEADYYGFTRLTTVHLKDLRCPILMAADEHPAIVARVTNKTPYKTNISIRALISAPDTDIPDEQSDLAPFEPGQTRTFSWPLSAESAVYHNFVLARVYMGGAYPMPAAEAGCGVYVLNLGGVSGAVVYWLIFALGVSALLAGVFLLEPPPATPVTRGDESAAPPPQRGSLASARRGLAIVAMVALYASYIGAWLLAVLCLIVILVILLGMLLIWSNREAAA